MKLLSGPLILVLSILSFYLIEKPFRNKKYKFKKIFILFFIFIIILISFTLLTINQNGFEKRVPKMFRDNLNYKAEQLYSKC
jgi:peptidoglycan/LPS O-acetylase OafA/YrhL